MATKTQKELFVSGHSGTTPLEVLALLSVCPLGLFIADVIKGIFYFKTDASDDTNSRPAEYVLEFTLVVIPTVAACTVFPSTFVKDPDVYAAIILSLVAALVSFNMFTYARARATTSQSSGKQGKPKEESTNSKKHVAEFSTFRGVTMLGTLICILAVDFEIFPRRFAKTENFGVSLMDVGVGLFVFSSALATSVKLYFKSIKSSRNSSSWRKLGQKIGMLLVLGALRTATVKNIEYQEHAPEYGVHLNFFFTLSGIFILHFLFEKVFFKQSLDSNRGIQRSGVEKKYLLSGLVVLICYQLCLMSGLENWILEAPRTTFISQNKEGDFLFFALPVTNLILHVGLCSLLGYFSLHQLAVFVGFKTLKVKEDFDSDRRGFIKALWIRIAIFMGVTQAIFSCKCIYHSSFLMNAVFSSSWETITKSREYKLCFVDPAGFFLHLGFDFHSFFGLQVTCNRGFKQKPSKQLPLTRITCYVLFLVAYFSDWKRTHRLGQSYSGYIKCR